MQINVHLKYYVDAARRLGIKVDILHPMLWARFEDGDKHWYILNTAVPLNNTPSTTIAKRKQLTNTVLRNAGFPVPPQHVLTSKQEARELFHKYGDIVLKPHKGLGGKHITILPTNVENLDRAYDEIVETGKTPLLEKFIKGDNYRILVLNGRVIDVVRRLPATVVADGEHTVKELIDMENARRHEERTELRLIKIDEHTAHALSTQTADDKPLTIDSIPPKGMSIHLSLTANLTQGGTIEQASDEIHPYYEKLAIDAVNEIGLGLGGLDLITPSISEPMQDIAINEINFNPGIRLHYTLPKSQQRDVAYEIMKEIRAVYRGEASH